MPQDHLARFVVEVIEQLDLSELVRQYAGRGSAAYHPEMLLGLLVFALDGTKIAANASKHKALSWEHANKIEAQLREEVQLLLKLAEESDSRPVNDGLDVPAEIARREQRLGAIAQAIEPALSMNRESHHIAVFERFATDTPAPETDDPVVKMAHRLGTKAGRELYGLRKQTVAPVNASPTPSRMCTHDSGAAVAG